MFTVIATVISPLLGASLAGRILLYGIGGHENGAQAVEAHSTEAAPGITPPTVRMAMRELANLRHRQG